MAILIRNPATELLYYLVILLYQLFNYRWKTPKKLYLSMMFFFENWIAFEFTRKKENCLSILPIKYTSKFNQIFFFFFCNDRITNFEFKKNKIITFLCISFCLPNTQKKNVRTILFIFFHSFVHLFFWFNLILWNYSMTFTPTYNFSCT